MYWRVTGLSTASPIDSILDKDDYTLEELLDEDELIQECKSLNTRLIMFLKQHSSLEYLVKSPSDEDDDPKRRFKYPFAACEVFCCEVDGIFQTLVEDEELLDLLFSILKGLPPLNCMLAGYFSRVVSCLLARCPDEVGAYLARYPDTLRALCTHAGTTSVAEVIVRLAGAGDAGAGGSPSPALDWLAGSELLPLLLRSLEPGAPADAAANAAEILAAVAQSPGSPLVSPLAAPEVLSRLVECALGGPSSGAAPAGKGDDGTVEPAESPAESRAPATHALDVCLALLEPAAGTALAHVGAAAPEPAIHAVHLVPIPGLLPPTPEQPHCAHTALRTGALRCLSREVGRLVGMLGEAMPVGSDAAKDGAAVHGGETANAREAVAVDKTSGADDETPVTAALPWHTSYGELAEPVGHARLKAVELLASLLHSADEDAESAVMGTTGVRRTMALVLAHPFNNALHHAATRALTSFESGSPALVEHLLDACGLVRWLLEAPRQVAPRGASRGAGPPRAPLRAGYAGHLTHIANRLLAVAAAGDARAARVRRALEAEPGWPRFVAEELDPQNELENVHAWRCGRPNSHGDMGDSFSSGLYERYGVYANVVDGDDEDDEEGSTVKTADDAALGGREDPLPAAGMDDMSNDVVLLDMETAEQLVELHESFERELRLHGGEEGKAEPIPVDAAATGAGAGASHPEAPATGVAASPSSEYNAFLFWKTDLPIAVDKSGDDQPGASTSAESRSTTSLAG